MATQFRSGGDFNNQPIVNVGSPNAATDAATKNYVDNVAAGLDPKPSVRAASTSNLTLSGLQTVDGVSLTAGQRVLVKDQTTNTANGIYAAASGAWTRTPDAVQGTLTPGALVIVEEGSVNADSIFLLTSDGTITVGTSAIVFTRFQAGITYTFGQGFSVNGSAVTLVPGSGIIVDAGGIRVDPTYTSLAKRYAVTTSAASSTLTVTHSLGTRDVVPFVWDVTNGSAWAGCIVEPQNTDANTITLLLGTAATAGQYRVVILA